MLHRITRGSINKFYQPNKNLDEAESLYNRKYRMVPASSGAFKLVEIIRHEVQQVQRPAEEVIIDDCELQQLLKVSRRTTANYRAHGLITYHHLGGKVFYILSDVLDAIKRNRILAIQEQLKFKA